MKNTLFKWTVMMLSAILILPQTSDAATNQFGETGLLSIATAETVGDGNFCAGIWSNMAEFKDGSSNSVMPFSLTYGMSNDLELNVSYPNVLTNNDAEKSDRGYMNVGFKGRLFGTNRSNYKLAFSAAMLKPESSDTARSRQTDYEGKLLFGKRTKNVKLHLGGGYRLSDGPQVDDEKVINGAVDLSFHRRMRFFLEGEWRSGGIYADKSYSRVTPGVQIFISPYMTLSAGIDLGVSGAGPDRRIIVGLSTCGGLGEYIIPIPKPPKAMTEETEKLRGKPPVPVLPKMIAARREQMKAEGLEEVALGEGGALAQVALAPASRYEIPVDKGEESVTLPSIAMPEMGLAAPSLAAPSAPALLPGMGLAPPSTPPPGVTASIPPAQMPGGEAKPAQERPRKGRTAKKFRLPDLMFDPNNWVFTPESMAVIEELTADILSVEGPFYIKIEGHTDSIGSAAYNEKLSLQRATAVAVSMMEFGVPAERVFIEGHGESRPIANNETAEGRNINRRVDILLIVPE